MNDAALFQETVVKVEVPANHYSIIRAPDGRYLGSSDGLTLDTYDYVDDKAVWQWDGKKDIRHGVTDLVLHEGARGEGVGLVLDGEAIGADGKPTENGAKFTFDHGPADLPSKYLAHFRENGWVCLPAILSTEVIDGLQKVSSSGAYENEPFDPRKLPLTENIAVAHTTVEPVSTWLIRQYMQTDSIKLGHAPSLAVLPPDDGERDVLAWHADFPYLWGITSQVAGGRIPEHDAGDFCMAVQRNVCITDFTKENGATCFKLGSHRNCSAPPEDWGTGAAYSQPGYRKEHGLPYTGPEAQAVEAPAGSIVIYDARTWHRTGINRSEHKRGAMLQAVIPMYIMPFMDTSRPYKAFHSSPLRSGLSARDQKELESLMVHKIVGPAGKFAIGVDWDLTEMTKDEGPTGQETY